MEVLKKLPKEDFYYGVAFAAACQLTSPTLYQCEEYDPPSDDYYECGPTDESQPSLETDEGSEMEETETEEKAEVETLSLIDDGQQEEEE